MNSFDIKILNNSAKFQDTFIRTVTAYIDFFHHVVYLENILEAFDESVENYSFEIWMSLGNPNLQIQSLIHQTISSINKASNLGMELEEETQTACQELLRLFLNCSQEKQKRLLGFSIPIPKEQVDRFISIFFELLVERWIYLEPEEIDEMYQKKDFMAVDIIDYHSFPCQLFLSCLGAKETIRKAGLLV